MEMQSTTPEPDVKPKVAKRISSAIKALQALQAEEAEHRKAFKLQKEALERAAAVEAMRFGVPHASDNACRNSDCAYAWAERSSPPSGCKD